MSLVFYNLFQRTKLDVFFEAFIVKESRYTLKIMNLFPKLFPLLIQILKLDLFKARSLTKGEVDLCRSVFGNLIDYDKVKIMNQPYLPWQHAYVFMAPKGNIHSKNSIYRDDYSKENITFQAVFIHEMTHILQHQHKINVLLQGAILQSAYYLSFKQYNPYKYQLIKDKSFWSYNIEQQGDIARDIFLKKIPNIILKN